jgi:hypothetical protein
MNTSVQAEILHREFRHKHVARKARLVVAVERFIAAEFEENLWMYQCAWVCSRSSPNLSATPWRLEMPVIVSRQSSSAMYGSCQVTAPYLPLTQSDVILLPLVHRLKILPAMQSWACDEEQAQTRHSWNEMPKNKREHTRTEWKVAGSTFSCLSWIAVQRESTSVTHNDVSSEIFYVWSITVPRSNLYSKKLGFVSTTVVCNKFSLEWLFFDRRRWLTTFEIGRYLLIDRYSDSYTTFEMSEICSLIDTMTHNILNWVTLFVDRHNDWQRLQWVTMFIGRHSDSHTTFEMGEICSLIDAMSQERFKWVTFVHSSTTMTQFLKLVTCFFIYLSDPQQFKLWYIYFWSNINEPQNIIDLIFHKASYP